MKRARVQDSLCFLLARMMFPVLLAAIRIRRAFVGDAIAPGKRRILIISDHRLGDTLYAIPLWEALRRAFPRAENHITIAVRSGVSGIAGAMPWFDEVVQGDAHERHPLIWILQGLLWRVSARRFEVIVNPVRMRSVGHHWLNMIYRPEASVSYDSKRTFDFCQKWCRSKDGALWGHIVDTESGKAAEEDFQEFVDAVSASGGPVNPALKWSPSFSSGGDAPPATASMVFVPGASGVGKRWPVENFIEVARRLLSACPGIRLMVVGSQAEWELGARISEALHGQVENLCGKTDLLKLAAVLAPPDGGGKVVVSNDTGTAHLAAIQGTQTVVVLGGADFNVFFPSKSRANVHAVFHRMDCFGCEWRCRYADLGRETAPCIAETRVDDVVMAVKECLYDDNAAL